MVDSHCHLADEAFVPDLEAVIQRAQTAGLTGALCIVDLTNPEESERAQRVRGLWPEVRLAVGVHPHQAGKFVERVGDVEPAVRRALEDASGASAVGESDSTITTILRLGPPTESLGDRSGSPVRPLDRW